MVRTHKRPGKPDKDKAGKPPHSIFERTSSKQKKGRSAVQSAL